MIIRGAGKYVHWLLVTTWQLAWFMLVTLDYQMKRKRMDQRKMKSVYKGCLHGIAQTAPIKGSSDEWMVETKGKNITYIP